MLSNPDRQHNSLRSRELDSSHSTAPSTQIILHNLITNLVIIPNVTLTVEFSNKSIITMLQRIISEASNADTYEMETKRKSASAGKNYQSHIESKL